MASRRPARKGQPAMTTGSLSMYEEIKALAKRNGGRVEDYIALAPQNDAFYAGTPGQRRIAEWFADLWHRFGYTYNVHIRRAHYQIMSQEPKIRLPDGVKIKTGDDTHTEVYINHDNCWNFLNNAAKAARYLGLIDPAALVDRRNPPPQVFLPYHPGEVYISAGSAPGDWATSLPDMPDAPAFYLGNYQGQQDYIVSLWCEKSTMNDILEPVARQFS